jgi:Family of unknown function (DUF6519)
MKSDATRDTFDPAQHLSRVIMQQGRVALDADHNEQVAIFWHYLRALARDVIGPYAGPVQESGFKLTPDTKGVLSISAGRYYVDGILVENEKDCLYTEQPGYPLPDGDPLTHLGKDNVTFFVYLDVWEHHVTWIEDGSLREVALGGPDTCTRAKAIWQVRVTPFKLDDNQVGGPSCADEVSRLVRPAGAALTARLDPGAATDDPCVMPPESKYRGAENQLYRVEIHEPGKAGDATFKWSRDNGSVLTALNGVSGNDLEVASARGFQAGDWVELTNDALDLRGEPGSLVRVAKVQGGTLSLDPDLVVSVDGMATSHSKVRRWNQTSSEDIVLQDGAVPITKAKEGMLAWIDLEDGVQVQFSKSGEYRTGDYWLIPARVATGTIEWPSSADPLGKPIADSPRGITHHYAPLGFMTWNGSKLDVDVDCRCTLSPAAVCGGAAR